MAYQDAIPQAGTLISISQGDILANFQAIDSTVFGFGRNHVVLTDGTNGGMHTKIDYYQAIASPALAGVAANYAKTVSANSELFYKNSGRDTQMTSSALVASSGEGYIPGGLQVRCGTANATSGGSSNNFSTAFPTACVAVIICANTSGSQVNVTGKSASAFTATSVAASCGVYFIALGY